jgi:hypothetical protein
VTKDERRQAGASEQTDVVITPRMIEAGKDALISYDPNDGAIDSVTSEEAVKAVYVAMVCALLEDSCVSNDGGATWSQGTSRRSTQCGAVTEDGDHTEMIAPTN